MKYAFLECKNSENSKEMSEEKFWKELLPKDTKIIAVGGNTAIEKQLVLLYEKIKKGDELFLIYDAINLLKYLKIVEDSDNVSKECRIGIDENAAKLVENIRSVLYKIYKKQVKVYYFKGLSFEFLLLSSNLLTIKIKRNSK